MDIQKTNGAKKKVKKRWIVLGLLGILFISFFIFIEVLKVQVEKEEDEKLRKEEQQLAEATEFFEGKLDTIVESLSSDPTISQHLSNIKYKVKPKEDEEVEDEESRKLPINFAFFGDLDDSFHDLSLREQYEFFRHAIGVISTEKKEMEKDFKYKGYLCTLETLNFDTKAKAFTMYYTDNRDFENPFFVDNRAYTSLREIDEADNPVEAPATPTIPVALDTDPSTANGYDWEQMNNAQKESCVSTVLTNLGAKGYTLLENPKWFIDALNAFYGDPSTNDTTVTEITVLSGVTGGVIIAP